MNRLIFFFIGILVSVCTALPASAQAGAAGEIVYLYAETVNLPIGRYVDYLEDKTLSLTIKDVTSPQVASRFQRSDREIPNFGLGDTAYWIRFTIADLSGIQREWLLEQQFPLVNMFDLYLPQPDGSWLVRMFGGDCGSILPHRNPNFSLPVTKEPTTFYIRAKISSLISFPLVVQVREHFQRDEGIALLAYGLYFGFMLTMALYNIYLFFLFRDRVYLYFVFYLFFFATLQMSMHGFLRQYLFPVSPYLDNQLFRVLIMASSIGSLLFSRRFLNSKENAPLLDRAMIGLVVVDGILIPIDMILPAYQALTILNLHTIVAPFLATATGVACYLRGFKPARFYLAARICFYTSLWIFAVNNVIFNNYNFWSWYGMVIGSFLEVLLLSQALADRISSMLHEKERVEADAMRAGRLALVGEMAAGIAHEVNNPLAGVILCLQNLLPMTHDDPERLELVKAVEIGLNKIRNTIASFLNFTRITVTEIKPVKLRHVIDNALALCRYQMEKSHVQVTTKLDSAIKSVPMDQNRMEQVIVNLILNACHAMSSEGGELTIHASLQGAWCRLTLSDTGPGISPEVLPRVFEPFFTTKSSGEGTGLGLSLCKTIVDAHGGSIVLESGPDSGTVCRIRLPL